MAILPFEVVLLESDIENLKNEIQILRTELKKIAKNREFTNPEVVGASKVLDALLVEYEKLLMNQK